MFELSIFLRDKLIGRSAFTIEEVRIGRSADNEVQIDNGALSRYHASIESMGGVHVIKDFSSQNGTYVNGERISQRRALNDGDRIQLGKYRLVYHAHGPHDAATAGVRDAAAYAVAGETDVALVIPPEARERPCPFVASLVAESAGKVPPRVHPLVTDLYVIGAHTDCDLRLDGGAPPRAAAIMRGWRGFQLLALAPGVVRNGQTVPFRSELADGDELLFGAFRLRYKLGRSDVTP